MLKTDRLVPGTPPKPESSLPVDKAPLDSHPLPTLPHNSSETHSVPLLLQALHESWAKLTKLVHPTNPTGADSATQLPDVWHSITSHLIQHTEYWKLIGKEGITEVFSQVLEQALPSTLIAFLEFALIETEKLTAEYLRRAAAHTNTTQLVQEAHINHDSWDSLHLLACPLPNLPAESV